MSFAVVGAGGWGTAFARMLANADHETLLWAREPELPEQIVQERENSTFLPGVSLPIEKLAITNDLRATIDADVVVLAPPSFGMAGILDHLAAFGKTPHAMINLAKGLDPKTRRTMSELILDRFPETSAFTLSGPSHAEEVGRDMPTAVVLAGRNLDLGERLQHELSTSRFRVYLSHDVKGVELCATVKNVIALATGIADGLEYGDNTRAALITRGLAEMIRFGREFHVDDATFFGLSGLGDMVATCTSQHSRNRYVGQRLGRGESLDRILSDM